VQVVSGALGREIVHYEAPASASLKAEMKKFLTWFNCEKNSDAVIKAALAHLWFVTIHPFDDGNGRIARGIADMQLARTDASAQRFYSMSSQIRTESKKYYDILEKTQKGNLDITKWLEWFLHCLNRSFHSPNETLMIVLTKAKFWEKHRTMLFNDRQKIMLNK
jgi:Fic family protein